VKYIRFLIRRFLVKIKIKNMERSNNLAGYLITIYNFVLFKKFGRLLILCLLLVESFQVFFYIKDIFILYFFSKIIVPCLACFIFSLYLFSAYLKNKIRKIDLWIFVVFIFLVFSSVINSYIYYQQPLWLGITAQLKLFSIFIFFLLRYMFTLLKVDIKDLENTILFLGLFSSVMFIIINLMLNPMNYWHEGSFLVKYSGVKGYYFKFPMKIFAQMCLYYYLFKILRGSKNLKDFLFITVVIIALFIYVKQRMFLFFVVIGIFISIFINIKDNFVKIFLSIVFLFFVFIIIKYALTPGNYISIYNHSMLIRINTSLTILEILKKEPVRLFLGSGNLSPLNRITYQYLYGQNFWVSDVGIIGLMFEFGIVGLIFLYSLLIILYLKSKKITKRSPLILQALKVNVLLELLSLPINVGIAYSIGIYMSYLAIFDFFERYGEYNTKSFKNVFLRKWKKITK